MLVDGRSVPVMPWGTQTGSGASVRRDGSGIVLDCGKGADDVAVSNLGCGLYGVTVNGKQHVFTRAEMERLTINAGKGNDRVTVGPGVDVPVRVNGGKGADQINNYSSGVQIDGGKGADQINSVGSGNSINGGKGADQINSIGNFNNITGGKGNDAISAIGMGNNVQGNRGHDDIFAYGFGNVADGGRGIDNVQNHTPFGCVANPFGWNRLGVPDMGSAYLAGYSAGLRDGMSGGAYAQGYRDGLATGRFLGAAAWGGAAAFGPGAWALDMTASLLARL